MVCFSLDFAQAQAEAVLVSEIVAQGQRTFCFGALYSSSWSSFASRTICSAVICNRKTAQDSYQAILRQSKSARLSFFSRLAHLPVISAGGVRREGKKTDYNDTAGQLREEHMYNRTDALCSSHWRRAGARNGSPKEPYVPFPTARRDGRLTWICAGTLFFTRVGLGMWMAVARDGSDVFSGVWKESAIFSDTPPSTARL